MGIVTHRDGTVDTRYTVSQEWIGLVSWSWVARFCGEYIGGFALQDQAIAAARRHALRLRLRHSANLVEAQEVKPGMLMVWGDAPRLKRISDVYFRGETRDREFRVKLEANDYWTPIASGYPASLRVVRELIPVTVVRRG